MTDQTDEILKEAMKDWLLDCFEEEGDREEIEELTYIQLIRAVNRYYDGGMKSFVATVLEGANIQW